MQIFGLGKAKEASGADAGKKMTDAPHKSTARLKHKLKMVLDLILRYQTPITAVLVVGLLAITTLRMLNYGNPAADDNRIQANLSKFKKIRIDSKMVERIKQLTDSQVSTGTKVEDSRNNPFSE